MLDSVYLIVTAIALGIVILLGRYLIRLNNTFFIFDAIGLGLFTVVGIEKTLATGFPLWVAVIMGTMTGAAGGVLRDILINEEPLIFRKEIYALACVFGGFVFWLCRWAGIEGAALQIITAAAVIALRIVGGPLRPPSADPQVGARERDSTHINKTDRMSCGPVFVQESGVSRPLFDILEIEGRATPWRRRTTRSCRLTRAVRTRRCGFRRPGRGRNCCAAPR